MMGFAWGRGLSVPLVGMMADRFGIERALTVMSALPLVAALLAVSLPSRKQPHVARAHQMRPLPKGSASMLLIRHQLAQTGV